MGRKKHLGYDRTKTARLVYCYTLVCVNAIIYNELRNTVDDGAYWCIQGHSRSFLAMTDSEAT